MQMLGYAVTRFGMSPSEFWEATPWETDAIALAYPKALKDAGIRQSYHTAHIVRSMVGGRLDKILKAIESRYTDREERWITPRTQAEFDEWVKKLKDAKRETQHG